MTKPEATSPDLLAIVEADLRYQSILATGSARDMKTLLEGEQTPIEIEYFAGRVYELMRQKRASDPNALIIFVSRAATQLSEDTYKQFIAALRAKILADPDMPDLDKYLVSKQALCRKNATEVHSTTTIIGAESGVVRENVFFYGDEARKNDAILAFNSLKDALRREPNEHIVQIHQASRSEPVIMVSLLEKLNDLYDLEDIYEGIVALEDAIDGALYLRKHNLVLEDIKLDNIGIVKDAKGTRGILFDLDGLSTGKVPFAGRLATPRFLPPEAPQYGFDDSPSPPTEAEMVYQFGICLKLIFKASIANQDWFIKRSATSSNLLARSKFQKINRSYESIIKTMTAEDPQKRPTLKEAYQQIISANNLLMLYTFPIVGAKMAPGDVESNKKAD